MDTQLVSCVLRCRAHDSHSSSSKQPKNTCSTACSILFIPKYQNYLTRILLTFTQMFLSRQDIQLKPNCLTVTQIFIYPKTQTSIQKHKHVSKNTNKYPKTQTSIQKHKKVSKNTNKYPKTQKSIQKHKKSITFYNTHTSLIHILLAVEGMDEDGC